MTRPELETFVKGLPNVRLDFPFGEEVAVYKVTVKDDDKMFALIHETQEPIRLSLKCAPELALHLREKYESVMEGYHLNKKHWNTMLLTGQLTDQEVKDLIVHSYNLVTGNSSDSPDVS